MADERDPAGAAPEASSGPVPYLGVGCFTAIAGAAGGAMLAVGVAHIVGRVRDCAIDSETGAPCGWLTYAVRGALIGAIFLSSIAIMRLRRGRRRPPNTDPG